jgi:transcriptional regulator of acetoin/glycerol metabolism
VEGTREWEKFHSGSPASPRSEILESWKRSRQNGIDPDRLELSHADIDDDAPLVRIGVQVLRKMADSSLGNSTSLALADADGTVTWRWDSERAVARCLDHVDFGPGSKVSEPSAGTNGIGLANVNNRVSLVVGAEHFKQPWHTWACAAAPVLHPITRRIVGYVNLACRAEEANHLLVVAVRALVSGVETAMGEAASARQRRMLEAHLSLSASAPGAVVTVDGHTMIVADSASDLNLDRAGLWERVRESGFSATELAINAELSARVYPVSPGRPDDGVTLVIHRGVPRNLLAASTTPKLNLTPLEIAERRVIADALAQSGNNKTEAAQQLGLSRGTLYSRMRRYHLD